MSESLSDISKKNKEDPIVEVCFIRASGKKVSISIEAYHAIFESLYEEASKDA